MLFALTAVAALALVTGTAAADVDALDFGEVPEGAEVLDGRFVVIGSNGQVASSGPRVGFFVSYSCTNGESIAIVVNAEQGGTEGGGSVTADCNGETQYAAVFATRNSGEPDYNDDGPVTVEGVGLTDARTGINDIAFAQDELEPSSTCAGKPATMVGTNGNDTLTGTPGDDVILGLGGNDRLVGLGGDDVLCGGDGGDTLVGDFNGSAGDSGDDTLNGGAGNDRLIGDSRRVDGVDGGNDTLGGGDGNDELIGDLEGATGDGGDDTLDGGAGNSDFLFGDNNGGSGGGGNDILTDAAGDGDFLVGDNNIGDGEGGNDTLTDTAGDEDTLIGDNNSTFGGGGGEDVLDAEDNETDAGVDGGPADDECITDPTDPVVAGSCERLTRNSARSRDDEREPVPSVPSDGAQGDPGEPGDAPGEGSDDPGEEEGDPGEGEEPGDPGDSEGDPGDGGDGEGDGDAGEGGQGEAEQEDPPGGASLLRHISARAFVRAGERDRLTQSTLRAAGERAQAADAGALDFGEVPEGAEVLDGRFVVIGSNGQVASSGPYVGFFVSYSCTNGESIAIVVNAEQGGTEGGGSVTANCNGETQYEAVFATRNRGEPDYSDTGPVTVEGVGLTDARTGINDLRFNTGELDAFSDDDGARARERGDEREPEPSLPTDEGQGDPGDEEGDPGDGEGDPGDEDGGDGEGDGGEGGQGEPEQEDPPPQDAVSLLRHILREPLSVLGGLTR